MKRAKPKPRLTESLKAILDLSSEVAQERRRIDVLIERNERALGAALNRPDRPPFVCILIEADSDRGRTQLATAGEVTNGERTFELQPVTRLYACRMVVFCDVSRVASRVFCGADMVSVSFDGCPVAFLPVVEIGVKVRVQCTVLQ